ncbi:MAG: DUF3160 domain-containing protein [Bacteroidales bacterium]|jgi:hypothetical protein|nr:DUF3160 domain-containing protein [Bacteroidales bacterium]
MKELRIYGFLCLICLFSADCVRKTPPVVVPEPANDTVPFAGSLIEDIDRQADVRNMNMQELRLFRSFLHARRGILLEERDLRDYWRRQTRWYDTLSRTAAMGMSAPLLTEEEQQLAGWASELMEVRKRDNYLTLSGESTPNVENIVNLFQYVGVIDQSVMDELAANGFALIPDSTAQLFQLYRENDEMGLPGFITSDLMLQLMHLYHACMLRTVEEERLSPVLSNLCFSLYRASLAQARKEKKEEEPAMNNAAFFAVAYSLLTGKMPALNGEYRTKAEEELAYIEQQTDHASPLLPQKSVFPYSSLQPKGHYSRSLVLRRYYKALKWLQTASFDMSDDLQRRQAVMLALLLQSDARALPSYLNLLRIMSVLQGPPACTSVADIHFCLQKERVKTLAAAMPPQKPSAVMRFLSNSRAVCFLPPPFSIDGEILHQLTDPSPDAERAFPKALDVLAAFGAKPAFDRLFHDFQEDTLWVEYPARMTKMTDMVRKSTPNPHSLFHQWMNHLLALLNQPPETKAWQRKKIATASASWAKWRHDMLLYGEIPDHPEPLPAPMADSDSLPEAITLGYVEPNVLFWEKTLEWMQFTEDFLKKYQLMTPDLQLGTARLKRYLSQLKAIAEKQAVSELPDHADCRFMAHIGDSIGQLSLSMVTPTVDRWQWVKGPDRSSSVKEQLYRRTASPQTSLFAQAGSVNCLYATVEINGFLYLTRGAVFDYLEFTSP